METLKEIIGGVKERLSSPLFGAFAVSWAICNWDILICLLKFDLAMLNNCGWSSYTECVSEQIDWEKGLLFPFLSTLAYALIFTPIKGLLAIFNSWVGKHLGNLEINQRKGSFVAVETIIKMQEALENKEVVLKERIEKYEETFTNAAVLQTEVNKMDLELSNVNQILLEKESELSKLQEQLEALNNQIKRKLEMKETELENLNKSLLIKDNEIKQAQDSLEELKDRMDDIVRSEQRKFEEIAKLKGEIKNHEIKNHELASHILDEENKKNRTLEAMQGEWIKQYRNVNGTSEIERFFIDGAGFYIMSEGIKTKLATLKHINWETGNNTKMLVFTKELIVPEVIDEKTYDYHRGKYLINEVTVEYSGTMENRIRSMKGMENGLVKVEYWRPI